MPALDHRRILVTRTRSQASELASALEALGAVPVLIPTIEIAPPLSYAGLDRSFAHLAEYEWLVFTSANAIEALCSRALALGLASPTHPRVAVIGSATAQTAAGLGLTASVIPERAVAEFLAEALLPHIRIGTRVLLVRAAVARDDLPETLRAAGAEVDIADAYRTVMPAQSVDALRRLFSARENYPHAITFTSSSTATNLIALMEAAKIELPREIRRASIGPITSRTLRQLNLPPHVEAAEATIAGLVRALLEHFAGKTSGRGG